MTKRRQHSEEDKAKIRATKKATRLRHSSMAVRSYELKINKKRLNRRQLNELEMIFLEGKRLYNFILNKKKEQEIPLNLIVPTDFHEVEVLDKERGTRSSFLLSTFLLTTSRPST